nr:molybdopterin converting factor subunit 1 [uncultured Rhodoferax sp.]
MKINLKYFASIREALGTGAETLDTAARDVAGLRDELIARGGVYAASLARGMAVRVAINQTLAEETAPLVEGAEVAFFPPVTGG